MKKVFLMCFCFIAMMTVTGCKEIGPGVGKIKEDIPQHLRVLKINDEEYDLTVDSLIIDKRATDDRDDEVYCTIEMSNPVYEVQGTYNCCYEYYDKGGWILEYAYLTDVKVKYVSDDFPVEMQDMLNTNTLYDKGMYGQIVEHYDVVETNWEQTGDSNFDILYDIKTESEYRVLSGIYKITLSLKPSDGLSYTWTYEKDRSGIDATWDIVGTYEGTYENSYRHNKKYCKIVIDSYDSQTNSVHIEYFKYDEDKGISSGDSDCEEYDITTKVERGKENEFSNPHTYVTIDLYRDDYGGRLRFEPDRVSYASLELEKVE